MIKSRGRIRGFILAAGLATLPAAPGSELLDGALLRESCGDLRSTPKDVLHGVNAGLCLGFVSGVRDTMSLYDGSSTTCWPSPLPVQETARVVMEYLESEPKQLHLPASTLVRLAL